MNDNIRTLSKAQAYTKYRFHLTYVDISCIDQSNNNNNNKAYKDKRSFMT